MLDITLVRAHQQEGVDADVGDRPAVACLRGVATPRGLLADLKPGEPALGIFNDHLAHGADASGSDPCPRTSG